MREGLRKGNRVEAQLYPDHNLQTTFCLKMLEICYGACSIRIRVFFLRNDGAHFSFGTYLASCFNAKEAPGLKQNKIRANTACCYFPIPSYCTNVQKSGIFEY